MHTYWFILAITGPLLYSLTNHIDKLLLERFFKTGGVGTLMLVSSLFSLVALQITFLGDQSVLDVGIFNILILAFVGLLNVGILWFYLMALQQDEASVTIVFYQLVPVIGLVLGYVLLGETITQLQFIAMFIIIMGATIISFDRDINRKLVFKKKTALFMLAADLCWALQSVIFKMVAVEENVWRSLFWEHLMMLLIGIAIFILIPKYRDHFLYAMKNNSIPILSLNALNETLYMTGSMVVAFAYLMAPVALVLLANSFQPIFVLLIGILLATFVPKLSYERFDSSRMTQKLVAIAITIFGTYLLLVY